LRSLQYTGRIRNYRVIRKPPIQAFHVHRHRYYFGKHSQGRGIVISSESQRDQIISNVPRPYGFTLADGLPGMRSRIRLR